MWRWRPAGVKHSHARELLDSPEAGRGEAGFPATASKGSAASQHLDFGHLTSRTERINFCCFQLLSLWSFVTAARDTCSMKCRQLHFIDVN